MRYQEIKPKPPLKPFVECFWILESDNPLDSVQNSAESAVQPERILPDGCVELILNFGAQFCEQLDDGRQESQPRHFLVGQMTRPMLIRANGRVELIGIRFHPGGTLPFFRLDLQEATNRVVELGAVSGALEQKLVSRMDEASAIPSLVSRIAVFEALLLKDLHNLKHDLQLQPLVRKIVDFGGRVTVDELSIDAGIGSRQLERRFLSQVGIGPKLLCRILRFQQIFRAVDQNNAGWAAVAAECGYYDQAHLIRDFQQFARRTPAVLFAQQNSLTQAFTRRNRTSVFSNTLA